MTIHKKLDVIMACKKIDPKPEHGVGQYGRVIDELIEQEPDFLKMSEHNCVEAVMSFMGGPEHGRR